VTPEDPRPPLQLVAQSHGGALRKGGRRGNKGGAGRPPNWFRETARKLTYSKGLLNRLAAIATGTVGEIHNAFDPATGQLVAQYTEAPTAVQIKAIELLLRAGQVLDKDTATATEPIKVVVHSLHLTGTE
jgi:hypothetical protein